MKADSPTWLTAKAYGDRAELAVAEWFKGRGFEVFKTLGRAEFDLLLQTGVEVKHDRRAPETGNVAIETHYRAQPSGILVSSANYWALVVADTVYIFETATLRDLVLSSRFPERQAGDGGAAMVKLIPLDKLKTLRPARVVQLPTATE